MNEYAKVCIIIGEASTVAKKCALVIYLRCEINLTDEPLTVFIDLKELPSTTADSVYNCLIECLNDNGFSKDYLSKNLMAFCSDGASTMMGRKSGVSAKLIKEFPNIIIWHCLNHHLQLALDDAITNVNQVNHFKKNLDKIYSIYHQSNKNQAEISAIAEDLEIEILKMGCVLGLRWAACSLRAANAVWRACPALYTHFISNLNFAGMAKKIEK